MWNPWKGGWTAEIPDGFHGMGDGFHTFGGWIPYHGIIIQHLDISSNLNTGLFEIWVSDLI